MRIAMFYHSLVSDWNHGNAHFLRGIASELLFRGHDVHVHEPRDNWSLSNLLKHHGESAIRSFHAAYPQLASTPYDLDRFDLNAALDDADLVIVHEWNDYALVRRIGEHRASRGNYRLLFHDTHHRAVTKPEAMGAYDLSHYDGVLAFGEVLRQIYLSRKWAQRVWTWHEAADTRAFRPLADRPPEGDLVWIGNWGDDERAAELSEFLIKPVKSLRLRGRIYGVRYPEHARRALAEAGIEYGNWLANFRVPEVFARFKMTVHVPRRPYANALAGIPTIRVFEALACGIPLVSAPWDDVEHLFTPGADYLVAHDGDEMKRHLRKLMGEPELRRKLAAHGHRTILSRHTCAHRVDELMEMVAELKADGRRPRRRRARNHHNGCMTESAALFPSPGTPGEGKGEGPLRMSMRTLTQPSPGVPTEGSMSQPPKVPRIPSQTRFGREGLMSGMKIAFFGSSLVSAYWNGAATYYRGIIRALHARGHRVTFYEPDAFDRQKHRDLPDPDWARVVVYSAETDAELCRCLDDADKSADLIIKASGVGVFDEQLDSAIAQLRRSGRIGAFWDVDAPATLDRVAGNPADPFVSLIPQYDLILTYGGGNPVMQAYESLGARRCVPIYNAVDPATHFPADPDPRFACDLGFLANRLPDREARVEEFFLKPARSLPGKAFCLGGNGWQDKPQLPANVKHVGHVYTRDHNAFNSTPLAVLNVNRQSMARYGFSPATRVFEAAGAAACLITDAFEGVEMFFEPGREILIARDGQQVVEHLQSLTPQRARAIGQAARRRVLAEHTYNHRAQLLDEVLGAERRGVTGHPAEVST